MKTDFRLTLPDGVEFTLTATMNLAEWKKIREQLLRPEEGSRWVAHPMSGLAQAITNLIESAERRFQENLADRPQ